MKKAAATFETQDAASRLADVVELVAIKDKPKPADEDEDNAEDEDGDEE